MNEGYNWIWSFRFSVLLATSLCVSRISLIIWSLRHCVLLVITWSRVTWALAAGWQLVFTGNLIGCERCVTVGRTVYPPFISWDHQCACRLVMDKEMCWNPLSAILERNPSFIRIITNLQVSFPHFARVTYNQLLTQLYPLHASLSHSSAQEN